MALFPLDIPAGVYKNGTDLEGQGRWQDASLVRWRDNTLRPVGGWDDHLSEGGEQLRVSQNIIRPRKMHTWRVNNGDKYIAVAASAGIEVSAQGAEFFDVTPSGFTAGEISSTETQDATVWSMDNWGQNLVAVSDADQKIYAQDVGAYITSTQFVTNPDFDSGLSDWSQSASNWTATTLEGNTVVTTATVNDPLTQTITGLTVGVFYQITVEKVTVTDPVVVLSNQATVSVTSGATYEEFETRQFSQKFSLGFLADATTATISLNMDSDLGNDPVYFKSVSVRPAFVFEAISGAPTCTSLVVTEERFLFALSADDDNRLVKWCDREDYTTWAPTATNEAGDILLQTSGRIMQGVSTRGQTLILTDTDVHAATYSGPPFVYGFQRVGSACGAISRNAAVDTQSGVFWMGDNGFFHYNGNTVQQIPCDVYDHVFGEMERSQKAKVWAWSNSEFGEVWWFYQSDDAENFTFDIDRYVSYDYVQGHWSIGALKRTCGAAAGVFDKPILIDLSRNLQDHELKTTAAINAFAETAPVQIANGDSILHITQMIPDEKTQGDVTATFKTRFHPNDTERSYGPYTMANPTSVRFTGRQVRMRVDGANLADWRVGIMRLDAVPGGRR